MSAKSLSAIALSLSILTFAVAIGTICGERTDPETKMHQEQADAESARDEAWRNAIRDVFQERHEAVVRWMPRRSPNLPRFMKVCLGIDTSGCPQDFRDAWLDYISACRRVEADPGAFQDLVVIGVELYVAAPTALHGGESLLKHDQQRKHDKAEAGVALDGLKKAAMHHGVEWIPDYQ